MFLKLLYFAFNLFLATVVVPWSKYHPLNTIHQFTQTNTLKFRSTVLLYYNLLYLAKHQLTEESSNILQREKERDKYAKPFCDLV